MRNIAIAISILLILSSCNCMKNKKNDKSNPSYAVQQTIVYKTIADFNNLLSSGAAALFVYFNIVLHIVFCVGLGYCRYAIFRGFYYPLDMWQHKIKYV